MRSQQIVPVIAAHTPANVGAGVNIQIYKSRKQLGWLQEDYEFYLDLWQKSKNKALYHGNVLDAVYTTSEKAKIYYAQIEAIDYDLAKAFWNMLIKFAALEIETANACFSYLVKHKLIQSNALVADWLRFRCWRSAFFTIDSFPLSADDLDAMTKEVDDLQASTHLCFDAIAKQPEFADKTVAEIHQTIKQMICDLKNSLNFNYTRKQKFTEHSLEHLTKYVEESKTEIQPAVYSSSTISILNTMIMMPNASIKKLTLDAEYAYFGFNKVIHKPENHAKKLVLGFDIDETLALFNESKNKTELIAENNLLSLLNEIDTDKVEVVAITARIYPEPSTVHMHAKQIIDLIEKKLGFNIFTAIYYTSGNLKVDALIHINKNYFNCDFGKRKNTYLIDDRFEMVSSAEIAGFSVIQADLCGKHFHAVRDQLQIKQGLMPPMLDNTNLVKPIPRKIISTPVLANNKM